MGKIVVGVDCSDSSKEALIWAAKEAVLRKSELEVLLCVSRVDRLHEQLDDATPSSEETLAGMLEEAIAKLDDAPDAIESRVIVSDVPAKILVEESADAELLVVGSRRLPHYKGALLHSVSQQVVDKATCPVVIVPGPDPLRREATVASKEAAVPR
ncbi:MAG: hypothetical protein KatS3mg008_1199 [Acidimicrobiales bacterium]|nr:MAG: hypothetical protein KatS3mg008_1199 [Acidimicrobiales bacterium]